MGEQIISASGVQHGLIIDSSGRAQVNASVSAGSESFLYGISGGDWMPIGVVSGTNAVLRTDASVTTGSEMVIVGQTGSLSVFPSTAFAADNVSVGFTRVGTGVFNTAAGAWDRARGSLESGLMVYSDKNIPVDIQEPTPTQASQINFATQLIYSGTVIGSLIKHNPAGGSFVQVLTYDGSDQLTNVGSWT